MKQDFLYPVQSVEGTNFTEVLAQNAKSAMNNLPGVPALASRRFLIRAILAVTTENFGPEFTFFSKALGLTTDPATDFAIAKFGFLSTMGDQLGGAGLWRYYADSLAIPYFDLDADGTMNPPKLHVVVQNISATGKSVFSVGPPVAGACLLTAWLEPMGA